MTKLEQVRDALYNAAAGDPNSGGISDRLAAILARVAIEAVMLEPTQEILNCFSCWEESTEDKREFWERARRLMLAEPK